MTRSESVDRINTTLFNFRFERFSVFCISAYASPLDSKLVCGNTMIYLSNMSGLLYECILLIRVKVEVKTLSSYRTLSVQQSHSITNVVKKAPSPNLGIRHPHCLRCICNHECILTKCYLDQMFGNSQRELRSGYDECRTVHPLKRLGLAKPG